MSIASNIDRSSVSWRCRKLDSAGIAGSRTVSGGVPVSAISARLVRGWRYIATLAVTALLPLAIAAGSAPVLAQSQPISVFPVFSESDFREGGDTELDFLVFEEVTNHKLRFVVSGTATPEADYVVAYVAEMGGESQPETLTYTNDGGMEYYEYDLTAASNHIFSVRFTAIEDNLLEHDPSAGTRVNENIVVELFQGANRESLERFGPRSPFNTEISDGDGKLQVSLNGQNSRVYEGEDITFTVQLKSIETDPQPSAYHTDVAVQFSVTGGTGFSDSDYANTTQVQIPAGATEATATISTTLDDDSEESESFSITLDSPQDSSNVLERDSKPQQHTFDGTLHDRQIAVQDQSATEGNTLVFTVSLDKESPHDVVLEHSITDMTTTSDDYTYPSGTREVTIAAGDTTTTISVPTNLDNDRESQYFTLSVRCARGCQGVIADGDTATGTIRPRPENVSVVSIEATTSAADEGNTGAPSSANLVFTVSIAPNPTAAVHVPYTLGGTADPDDYMVEPTSGSPLMFQSGETMKTITVSPVGDNNFEGDEAVIVTLEELTDSKGDPLDDAIAVLGDPRLATGTIRGDDEPELEITLSPENIREDASTKTVDVGVRIKNHARYSESQTFELVIEDDSTATIDADYLLDGLAPYRLTLPEGENTTDPIQITVINDAIDEEEMETININAVFETARNAVLDTPKVLTIADDDTAELALTVSPGRIVETNSSDTVGDDRVATLSISITNSVTADRNIDIDLTFNGSAVIGNDYRVTGASMRETDIYRLTLMEGESSVSATIMAVDDSSPDEEDETVMIRASIGTSVIGDQQTLTIAETYIAPSLTFSVTPATIHESGGPMTATATIAIDNGVPFNEDQTFTLLFHNGAAAFPHDFSVSEHSTFATRKNVTLEAGAFSVDTIFTAVEDNIDEGESEYVFVRAFPVGNERQPIGGGSFRLTIIDDDDVMIRLSPEPGALEEHGRVGHGGRRQVTVGYAGTARYPGPRDPDRQVRYFKVTVDETSTATLGDDFVIVPRVNVLVEDSSDLGVYQLGWAPGEESTQIVLDGRQDDIDEEDEEIVLRVVPLTFPIVNEQGNSLPNRSRSREVTEEAQTVTVILSDDDNEPTVSVGAPPETVDEGVDLTITVNLDGASSEQVSVAYEVSGELQETDYRIDSPNPLVIEPGERMGIITINAVDDNIDEPNEDLIVTLVDLGTANATLPTSVDDRTVTSTIIDADDPNAVLSMSGTPISVNEGEEIRLTVNVAPVSGHEITAFYSVGGTGTHPADESDYTSDGEFVIAPYSETGEIIIQTASGDGDEFDEMMIVTLVSELNGKTLTLASPAENESDRSAAATILDTDDPPVLTITGPTNEASEGENLVFTVNVNAVPASQREITVTYSVIGEQDSAVLGATAAEDEDFTDTTGGVITIAPGSASGRIIVSADDDDIDDILRQSVKVTLLESNNGNTLTNATLSDNMVSLSAYGVILDVDIPVLTIMDGTAEEGQSITFTVEKNIVSEGEIEVEWSLEDDTALREIDYTGSGGAYAGRITFDRGIANGMETITIDTVDNEFIDTIGITYVDGSRTFTLTLAESIEDYGFDSNGRVATGTITDDEEWVVTVVPDLSVRNLNGIVEEEGEVHANFNFRRVGQTRHRPHPDGLTEYAGSLSVQYVHTKNNTGQMVEGTFEFLHGVSLWGLGSQPDQDDIPTADYTITIQLEDPTETQRYSIGSDRMAVITVTDNTDPDPVVSIHNVTGHTEVTEGDGNDLRFRISLDGPSGKTIEVPYSLGGTAVLSTLGAPEDFTISPSSPVRFAPDDERSREITVTVTDDDVDEPAETVIVTLGDMPINATTSTDNNEATGTINDNDLPVVSVGVSNTMVNEDDDVSFTLTRVGDPTDELTVSIAIEDSDDALVGAAPITAVFESGSLTEEVELITTDNVEEADASVMLTVASDSMYLVDNDNNSAAVTVVDDDEFSVTITGPGAPVIEGNNMEFMVTLGGSINKGRVITIPYSINQDATDTADATDYTDTTGGMLEFPMNSIEERIVLALSTNDGIEPQETVSVTLGEPTPTGSARLPDVVAQRTAEGMIEDNDLSVVTVRNAIAVNEGGDLVFVVDIVPASDAELVVSYSLMGDGVTAEDFIDADLTELAGTLRIPMGTNSAEIALTTAAADGQEMNEEVTLTYTYPMQEGGAQTATGTINDRDMPMVSVSDALTVKEGGELVFRVSVFPLSRVPLNVSYALSGTDVTASDFNDSTDLVTSGGLGGTLMIPADAAYVDIALTTATGDGVEAEEEVRLTLSDMAGMELDTATGRIIDGETPEVSISVGSRGPVTEGGDLVFDLTIVPPSTGMLDIAYVLSGAGITEMDFANDNELTFPNGTVRVDAGSGSFTIDHTTADDGTDEDAETVTVTLVDGAGYNVSMVPGESSATNTINDPETPLVTVRDAPAVTEGDDLVFQVTVDPPSATDLAVAYTLSGTNVQAEDFDDPTDLMGGLTGTLTIPMNSSSVDIELHTADDDSDTGNDDVTLTLSAGDGYDLDTASGTNVASGTIINYDQPPASTQTPRIIEVYNDSTVRENSQIDVEIRFDSELSMHTIRLIAGGTATPELDYTVFGVDGSAEERLVYNTGGEFYDYTITARRGQTVIVRFKAVQDTIVEPEPNETIVIDIHQIDRNSFASTGQAINFEVRDRNEALEVSFKGGGTDAIHNVVQEVFEGEDLEFTVQLENNDSLNTMTSSVDILVPYTIVPQGTTQSADFESSSLTGQVMIPAGQTEAIGSIAVATDSFNDTGETFRIDLDSNPDPSGAWVKGRPNILRGTILDSRRQVRVAPSRALEGENLVFNLTLDPVSSDPITLDYDIAAGTATEGSDYNLPSGARTVTFAALAGVATITVPTLRDSDSTEGNETLSLTVSCETEACTAQSGSLDFSGATATGTIEDRSTVPTVTVSAETDQAVEGSGPAANTDRDLVFEVEITPTPEIEIRVPYYLRGMASLNDDYVVDSGSESPLIFRPGNTRKTIRLSPVKDYYFEEDETVIVSLSAPVDDAGVPLAENQARLGAEATATGTIQDDDMPEFSLMLSETTIVETGGSSVVTVSVTNDTQFSDLLMLNLNFGGTATLDEDYSLPGPAPYSLSLAANTAMASAMATITAVSDLLDEGQSETVEVSASLAGSGDAVGIPQTMTITDDDNATLVIEAAPTTISETNNPATPGNDTESTITVKIDNGVAYGQPQTINLSVGSGSEATTAVDFAITEQGRLSDNMLTLPADDLAAVVTATLVARPDQVYEPGGEDVVIEATHVEGGNASIGSVTITIDDDDTPMLEVSLAGAATEFGEADGATTATVAITNFKVYATDQMFDLTFSGTATLATDGDYTVTGAEVVSGSPNTFRVTLPAGDSSINATITITNDNFDEGDETIIVAATHVNESSAAVGQTTLTITDDDNAMFTFTATPSTIDEHGDSTMSGGRSQLMVAIDGNVRFDVVKYFKITFPDTGTATYSGDYRLDPTTGLTEVGTDTGIFQLGLAVGQNSATAAIGAVQDTTDEGLSETIDVRIVPLTGPIAQSDGTAIDDGSAGQEETAAAATLTITITDDDNTIVTVMASSTDSDSSAAGVSVVEATSVEFTLTRDGYTEGPLTVNITVAAATGTLTGTIPETAVFAAGSDTAMVTIATRDDELDENDETVTLGIGATDGVAAGTPDSAVITVTDDDDPPTVTVTGPAMPVVEGGDLIFTVGLSEVSGKDITVGYTIGGDVIAADYSNSTANPLPIDAGETEAMITIGTLADNRDEPDENLTITLGALVNATAGATQQTATGIIEDGDNEPVVSIAGTTSTVNEGGDLIFEVTVRPQSGKEIIVPYSVVGSGVDEVVRAEDVDFADAADPPGTLTIPANTDSGTITINTAEDMLDERNETLTVTILEMLDGVMLVNADLSSPPTELSAVGTITDVNIPAFTFANQTESAIEGTDITFTVRKDIVSYRSIDIVWTITDDTAVEGTDYEAASATGTLTFMPDDLAESFTVTTRNVDGSDGSKQFTVTLSLPSTLTAQDATLPDPPTATGRVVDDDQPLVTVAVSSMITNSTVMEGASAIFTLTRTGDTDAELDVPYTITQQEMRDVISEVSPIVGTAVFAVGSSTFEVSQSTVDDSRDEEDATLTLALDMPGASAGYAVGLMPSAVITVADNDPEPTARIEAVVSTVEEGAPAVPGPGNQQLEFSVQLVDSSNLEIESDKDISIPYTLGGDATLSTTPGTGDYSISPASPLTFAAGTVMESIYVTVEDDDLDEPAESLTITLGTPTNAMTDVSSNSATGTINDNDLPVVTVAAHSTITNGTVTEGQDVVFTLTRAGVLTDPLTVSIEVVAPSNALNSAAPTEAMFAATSATADVTMPTLVDTVEEADAVVTLTVAAGSLNRVGDPGDSATITVADDDEFTVAISGPASSVAEGESMEFTVTLEGTVTMGRNITIPYTINEGSSDSADADDYMDTTGGSLVFEMTSIEETIVLALQADGENEPQEIVSVTLGEPTPAGAAALPVAGADRTASGMIDDGDTPVLSIANASAEEGLPVEFTVMVDPPSYQELMVVYSLTGDAQAGNTATEGEDYTNPGDDAARTLTIDSGTGEYMFTVATLVDEDDEADETFTVALGTVTPVDGGVVADGAGGMATGTIFDNNLPIVSVAVHDNISNDTVTEADDVVFTLTRVGDATGELEVTISVEDSAGALDAAAPETATFLAGNATVDVTMATTDDTVEEADSEVTLTVVAGSDNRIGVEGVSATVTVADDDEFMLAIAPPSSAVAEGTAMEFTVTLEGSVTGSREITVPYTIDVASSDTADPSDYMDSTPVAGSVVFTVDSAVGTITETTKAITLDIAADGSNEPQETVSVTLGDPSPAGAAVLPAVAADRTASGQIDDGDTPVLSIVDGSSAVEGMPVEFTVMVDPPSYQELMVVYTLTVDAQAENTATEGDDYTNPGDDTARTLTIDPDTEEFAFTVATVADTDLEANETFMVTLVSVSPDDAAIIASDGGETAVGTIEDDDRPTVSIEGSSATEGSDITFTVSLSAAVGSDIMVLYTLEDETAAGGTDYVNPTLDEDRTITIPVGETSQTFAVETVADDDVEQDETFIVNLESVSPDGVANVSASGGGSAKGTIINDDVSDVPSVVTVDTAPATVEGGDLVFAVSVSPASAVDISLTYDLSGTGVTAADFDDTDLSGLSGTLAITANTASTSIVLTTAVDSDDEDEETVTLTLAGVDGDTATGVIRDGDLPVVMVADAPSAIEGDDLVFAVSVSPVSATDIDLAYELTGAGVTAEDFDDTDLTGLMGTLAIPANTANASITLTTAADDVDEPNETVQLMLTSGGSGSATGTITNREPASDSLVVSIAGEPTVSEGGNLEFTVSLNQANAVEITVGYELSGTADAGDDYTDRTEGAGTLTFAQSDEASSLTITIETLEDSLDEDDEETVVVMLTSVTPQGAATLSSTSSSATGTITDGDASMLTLVLTSSRSESGQQIFDFEAMLEPPSATQISVDFEVGGDAEIGVDYTCSVIEFDQDDEESADTESTCPELANGGSLRSLAAARSAAATGGDHAAQDGNTGTLVFEPQESRKTIRMMVLASDEAAEQPKSIVVTLGTVTPSGAAEIAEGAGTVTASIGISALAELSRDGAITMLHHHVSRFETVTSSIAMARLSGANSRILRAEGVDGIDSVEAIVRADGSVSRWAGWGSVTYGSVSGRAEGSAYDVYVGTDTLTSGGNGVLGFLVGYESGDLEKDAAEYSSTHLQVGVYGAARTQGGMTFDGAVAVGSADPSVAADTVTGEFGSQRITARAAIGGSGWQGSRYTVQPTAGVLYTTETLDGFTDSAGGTVEEETLSITRLSAGVRLIGRFEGGEFVLQPQLNYDSESLGEDSEDEDMGTGDEDSDDSSDSSVSSSVRGTLRFHLRSGSILQFTGSYNGLGNSDTYQSFTLGLDYSIAF